MRYFLLTILICLFFFYLSPDDGFSFPMQIRGQVGYNYYSMKSLKTLAQFQRSSYQTWGIDAKIVQEFPSTPGFQLQAAIPFREYSLAGLVWDYASTGARIHYADYSGYAKTDMVITRQAFGFLLERIVPLTAKINFVISLQSLVIYSRLNIKQETEILERVYSSEMPFRSISVGFIPLAELQFAAGHFLIGLRGGYEYDAGNRLYYLSDTSRSLNDGKSGVATSDWDGFRIGLMVGWK